ncbi:MAG: CotH kinase family protein [Prevotella sp.]|nr:CotH kinase family protein [Prevotella sp.]
MALAFVMCHLSLIAIQAAPDFDGTKRYHIVCRQFMQGCVTDGATAGQNTPLYHLTQARTTDETYWTMTEQGDGQYYIRNSKTGQYVTYDGVRQDPSQAGQLRRYVSMTAAPNGNRSLWTFTEQGTGIYTIRNVQQADHIWDVRTDSYCVGTYSNSGNGNQNQLFSFFDEQGQQVMTAVETDPLAKCLENFAIDGRAPVYVESLDLYLCTVPLENFGADMSANITYTAKPGCGLKIEQQEVASGEDYTFAQLAGNASYTVTATTAGGATISKRLMFTSLPVVQMSGSFSNDYSQGLIAVHEPDKGAPQTFDMKAKWRGGITNGNDKHKRNYHVKLLTPDGEKAEQSFFGLRSDDSWILESCQVDMLRIRNRMLTDLWNSYATQPYYADREPKARSGTRGRFVELVLNGEYRGIYCMTENMDRKQMKLRKYDEDGTLHGLLWKSKDWSYSVFMGHYSDNANYPGTAPVSYNNRSSSWDSYNLKYPDLDDVTPTDWSPLYNAVRFVCVSSNTVFKQQFTQYFDLPVVMDYYILMETILSTDNHGKNMFFACYDKQNQADRRITLGVWDMDATCGQRWSDVYWHQSFLGPEQDYAQFITNYEHGDYNLFRRLRQTDANDFNMQVRLRYRDLRQGPLATDSILSCFRRQVDEFQTCGAATREQNKWSYDSDVAGRKIDFQSELTYLTNWITRRMTYLDNVRFNIAELPSSIGNVTRMPTPTADRNVYDLSGRRVASADDLERLPAGIYVVNGHKIIVSQ